MTNLPDGDSPPLSPFEGPDPGEAPDEAAREFAIDPRENVVLEASAGTGKTSVLVRRYLALLAVGVEPGNILAITFTRKAAAEMRDRIVVELRRLATQSAAGLRQWRELRDRLGDISISTIDAFCLALLGEFPLEAGLDPGFGLADETEVAAAVEAAVVRALDIARARTPDDESLRLLLAQLPTPVLVRALGELIDRREVAGAVLAGVAGRVPPNLTATGALRQAADSVAGALNSVPGGLLSLTEDRPVDAAFDLVRADIASVVHGTEEPAVLRAALEGLRHHFIKADGRPRVQPRFPRASFATPDAWRRHKLAFRDAAPRVAEALARLDRDTNLLLARGLARLHGLAVGLYRRSLDDRDVVDFAEALARTENLLANMDEFSQSRYRLESRYHHVLVDEFQDTSRQQWQLVSHLVEAWGEGQGLVHEAPLPPSIFVVGDHKQSIYRFRDADVTILGEAGRFIAGLRPRGNPRRTISRSFRARPELLAFVNALSSGMAQAGSRADAFRYEAGDHFPLEDQASRALAGLQDEPVLGLALADTDAGASRAVADEIARLLGSGATVRDRDSGLARAVRPGDIAVVFRARESHRAVESALESDGIPTYVFKGLGFFAADEVQDVAALVRYLARPGSPLCTAAFLRSRLVRLSDPALLALASGAARSLPDAILGAGLSPSQRARLADEDRRVLDLVRASVPRWLSHVDRVSPAELIDAVLSETDYLRELRGARAVQARENVKKVRMLVRRLQSRGYLTMLRLAEHLDRLSAGDDANAVIDAAEAVNLMTIHAAKGLEFPVVFVVGLGRGTGDRAAVRVEPEAGGQGGRVEIAGVSAEARDQGRQADLEETKRLLYVATTRARDRLYLAATVRRRRLRKGRGSLGEVLPASFVRFLEEAAACSPDLSDIAWPGTSGRRHRFALCRPRASEPRPPDEAQGATSPGGSWAQPVPSWPAGFEASARVLDARVWAMRQCGLDHAPGASAGRDDPELVGRLVHGLFQAGLAADAAADLVSGVIERLLRDEADVPPDTVPIITEAGAAFRAMRGRSDVATLLAGGRAQFEVPFTLLVNSVEGETAPLLLRGTIDCVVITENRVTVLEFKTGRPARWHQVQLDVYVRAAAHVWPGAQVEGHLVYDERA